MAKSVVVVGAGVFGVTAALELRGRGWEVTLIDPGSPHPRAASTDISKMIRADYGADELYMELMEACFPRWRAWNEQWNTELYHETGFLVLAGGPMDSGGFEHTSAVTLRARGRRLEVLGTADIRSRFPAWEGPPDLEGYFNPVGGWAASESVVRRLVSEAAAAGVTLLEATVRRLRIEGSTVTGAVTDAGDTVTGDVTVVAAGAWTHRLVPRLDELVVTTGHPIIHFRPLDIEEFRAPGFPPWAADIAATGWYGFPAIGGVVKVANHGPGRRVEPTGDRTVGEEWEPRFRRFLADWLPSLADAPIDYTRLCLYTDTADGDFLIDHHPELAGLVVSTGGSGHGFKFAPILGALAADVVQETAIPDRFHWRPPETNAKEAARHRG